MGGNEIREAAARAGQQTDNEDVAFIDAIAAGRRAHPDVAIALRAHEVIDAAYRSAKRAGVRIATPTPARDVS